jgi:chaperonin cofactor prefoldin
MVWTVILDWAFKALVGIGGLGGLLALILVRQQKRKLVADTGKTVAEADLITEEAQTRKTTREALVLDMYERGMANMQERLDDAEDKLARLTEYVEILVQALRETGAAVPAMPKKMAEDAHRQTFRVEGGDARPFPGT